MDLNTQRFSVTQGGTISPSSIMVGANTAHTSGLRMADELLGAVRVWVEGVCSQTVVSRP